MQVPEALHFFDFFPHWKIFLSKEKIVLILSLQLSGLQRMESPLSMDIS